MQNIPQAPESRAANVEFVCLMLLALNLISSDNEFDFRSLRDVTIFINNKKSGRRAREKLSDKTLTQSVCVCVCDQTFAQ